MIINKRNILIVLALFTGGVFGLIYSSGIIHDFTDVDDTEVTLEGSGTEDDPYQIYTSEDLYEMHYDYTAYYELRDDITLNDTIEPIGENRYAFEGQLNGNNYTIHNLHVEEPDDDFVGLFGSISEDGIVKNINIKNSTVYGDTNVGILTGENNGHIERVSVKHSYVNGNKFVGGIAGYNDGTMLMNNIYDSTINGNEMHTGNITGYNTNELIGVYAENNTIYGEKYTGNITGYNGDEIAYAYSKYNSIISDENQYIGGFTGHNENLIQNTYSIQNNDNIPTYTFKNNGVIINSYSTDDNNIKHNNNINYIETVQKQQLKDQNFYEYTSLNPLVWTDYPNEYPKLYWSYNIDINKI